MKIRLLGFLSLLILLKTQFVSSQSIPNGGFEDWEQSGTFEHPVVLPAPAFESSNSESFYKTGLASVTKVTGVTGSAMRVENLLAPNGDTIKAYAAWGEGGDEGFSKGIPLPSGQALTGLTMKMKYNISPTFKGFVGVIPTKNGTPVSEGNGVFPGAYVYYITGTQTTFTLADYTFSPALTDNPDECIVFISAADMTGTEIGNPGDFLEVDDIAFTGTTDPFPGGNMELWESSPIIDLPKDWNVEIYNPVNKTFDKSSDSKSGNSSLLLKNIVLDSERKSVGRASIGDWDCSNDNGPCDPIPGMKVNSAPNSIGFYYKYETSGIDTASCWVELYKNGNAVANGWNYFLPTSEWKFGSTIINTPGETPDSVLISFESGRWETAVDGSTLLIDDVKFHYCDEVADIAGPTSVCAGSDGVKFSINEDFASGYSWSTTVGTISSGANDNTVTIDGINAAGTITVTKTYADGCPSKSFDLNITMASTAVANAGPDKTVCANNAAVNLSGSVIGATGGEWTTSGTGTFDDAASLSAVYTPSVDDITSGNVTLTLTPTGTGSCGITTDQVLIAITAAPTVDAGADQSKCANNAVVTLAGSKTVATGSLWSTTGSGAFANTTSLSTTYTPSAADITAGSVNLTLTTIGSTGCIEVSDVMKVTFTAAPTADAGSDQSKCANDAVVTLAGSVTVATGGAWTTSGSGTFGSTTDLSTTYTPSSDDMNDGTIELVLTSTDNGSCNSVKDTLVLTFSNAATADAGADASVCNTSSVIELNGSVTVATGGSWTTTGSGTFDNANALVTTYTPSVADITAGSVTFTLTSTDNGSCSGASDEAVYTFTVCTGTQNKLASLNVNCYPNPAKDVVTFELGKEVKATEMMITDELIQIEKTIMVNELTDRVELDLSGINSGVHMVIIRTEEGAVMKKVIKM